MNFDQERYASLLGKLVSYLQSLEFLLRAYLYNHGDPPHNPLPDDTSLYDLKVDETVGVNALTSYDTLRQLIERYNYLVSSDYPELCVDPWMVTLRDAIAHGRISSSDPSSVPALLKFGRPTGDMTKVDFLEILTPEWLKKQRVQVYAEIFKVAKAPDSPVVV